MIQACSNDPQVTFHAIHNLIETSLKFVGHNMVLFLLKMKHREI